MIKKAVGPVVGPIVSGLGGPPALGDTPAFYAPLLSSLNLVRGTGSATFTRALAAYYYDSAADLLVEALTGVPRFETKGYLNEPSRQNQVKDNSEYDSTGANWITDGNLGVNAFYTADTDIAPDGTQTADSLEDRSNTANPTWYQSSIAYTNGVSKTLYVYVKKDINQTSHPFLRFIAGAEDYAVGVNVATGAVAQGGPIFVSNPDRVFVELVGGYWKFGMVVTPNATGTGTMYIYPTGWSDSGTPYVWDVTAQGTNIFWGAQFTTGDFSTSTINTGGATVTRPADSLTYPAADNLNVNDCSGKFEYTPMATVNELGNDVLCGSRVDADNYLWVVIATGGTLKLRKRIAGVNYDADFAFSYTAGVTYTIKWRMSSTLGLDVWVDNVKGANHANTTDAVISTDFGIGSDDVGINPSGGNLRKFKIWLDAPSDAVMAGR